MADFSSILNIIFIVFGGVLTFIILFIFAKRQITRFALRSRRGPHVPIGAGVKKALRKEIERRIECIPRIVHEPRLLSDEPHYIIQPTHPYHYRFKAVDDVKTLEEEIARQDPGLRRHPNESLRAFLLSSLAAPLDGRGQKLVHQFCDTYEFARFHPGVFGEDEYEDYRRLLMKLIDAARLLKSVTSVGRMEPARECPATRRPRLLDAARLRPQTPSIAKEHRHYTALENLPVELEPKQSVVATREATRAPDETAV